LEEDKTVHSIYPVTTHGVILCCETYCEEKLRIAKVMKTFYPFIISIFYETASKSEPSYDIDISTRRLIKDKVKKHYKY